MQKFVRTTWISLGGLALLLAACGKSEDSSAAEPAVAESPAVVAETPAPTPTPTPAPTEAPAPALSFDTVEQRASYGLGYNFGNNIVNQGGFEADLPALIAGLEDGLEQSDLRLSHDAIQAALQEIQHRHEMRASAQAAANMEAAREFLTENAKRPEVTVTGSGLQYEVLSASEDPDAVSPGLNDTVTVHYRGTLLDGTVFDSSIERGEPISFPVSGVISGWTEALTLMSVGDRWKLYLPPPLAYGTRGAGPIPPNSALIFEVELLGVTSAETEPSESDEAPTE